MKLVTITLQSLYLNSGDNITRNYRHECKHTVMSGNVINSCSVSLNKNVNEQCIISSIMKMISATVII